MTPVSLWLRRAERQGGEECGDRRELTVRDPKGKKSGGDLESRRKDLRREWKTPRKKDRKEKNLSKKSGDPEGSWGGGGAQESARREGRWRPTHR